MNEQRLTHLKTLEAESIHILREVVAEFENPAMLYIDWHSKKMRG